MKTAAALTADIIRINEDTKRVAEREGFEYEHRCTGKVFLDAVHEAVWYEMADKYNTTTWASLDYPDRTAWDEIVVVVDSTEDALDFPNWVND